MLRPHKLSYIKKAWNKKEGIWCGYPEECRARELGPETLKALTRLGLPTLQARSAAASHRRLARLRIMITWRLNIYYILNACLMIGGMIHSRDNERQIIGWLILGMAISLILLFTMDVRLKRRGALASPEHIESLVMRILLVLFRLATTPSTIQATYQDDDKKLFRALGKYRQEMPYLRKFIKDRCAELVQIQAVHHGFPRSYANQTRLNLEGRLLYWCALEPQARLDKALEVSLVLIQSIEHCRSSATPPDARKMGWLTPEVVGELPELERTGLARAGFGVRSFLSQSATNGAAFVGLAGVITAALIGLLKN